MKLDLACYPETSGWKMGMLLRIQRWIASRLATTSAGIVLIEPLVLFHFSAGDHSGPSSFTFDGDCALRAAGGGQVLADLFHFLLAQRSQTLN